jgi:hypothetical protein
MSFDSSQRDCNSFMDVPNYLPFVQQNLIGQGDETSP